MYNASRISQTTIKPTEISLIVQLWMKTFPRKEQDLTIEMRRKPFGVKVLFLEDQTES